MKMTATEDEEATINTIKKGRGHTAIIYFHGIGNPNLHVSLSNFLDSFDLQGQREFFDELGKPRNFKYRIKIVEDRSARGFVQFRRIKRFKKRDTSLKVIRAYEGYWGDDHDRPVSILQLLQWTFLTVWVSISAIFANWRKYPSLKLRYLNILENIEVPHITKEKITRLYRDFENWESRKQYPEGTFSAFIQFLSTKNVLSQYGDFRETSRRWRRSYVLGTLTRFLRHAIAIALMFGILSLVFCLSVNISASILSMLEGFSGLVLKTASGVLVSVLVINTLWALVRRRFSDVITWTLNSESDERYAVRERRVVRAMELVREIVGDPECEDCIVIGHSLGSAIALEAIIREGRMCEAVNLNSDDKILMIQNMRKIKYIFSIGSPVDHILSLFQKDRTFSHRFSRLAEQRGLSFSGHPFSKHNGEVGARVINFWSRFDPISGPIYSLMNPSNQPETVLCNVECMPLGSPNPLKAHSGFFFDIKVMAPIYRAVMTGRLQEKHLKGEKISWWTWRKQ